MLYGRSFQNVLLTIFLATTWSYYPVIARRQQRFGLFPLRSPLLWESLVIFSSYGY